MTEPGAPFSIVHRPVFLDASDMPLSGWDHAEVKAVVHRLRRRMEELVLRELLRGSVPADRPQFTYEPANGRLSYTWTFMPLGIEQQNAPRW